jgi:hypothetical protein
MYRVSTLLYSVGHEEVWIPRRNNGARKDFFSIFFNAIKKRERSVSSVGDPDPDVFGPPRSGSISQRYGSGSFPFLINVLSGLK